MTDEIKSYRRRKPEYGRGKNCSTVLDHETYEGVRLHMRMHKISSLSGAIHDLVRIGLGLPPLR